MMCCERLRQGEDVRVHSAQNGNMEDLVRAPPDVEHARCETFGAASLRM